jgi:uroporphyrinogen decarboxylase
MDAKEMDALFAQSMSFENVTVPDGEMTPLDRFNAIMDFKKPDRIIDAEFGYWDDTLKRWHNEGLPEFVNSNEKADIYFGFDEWKKSIPCKLYLVPPFEEKVLEDDGHHKIILDDEKIKCEVFSDGTDSIPHYLEFPVKDRETYQEFKERLRPDLDKRLPGNLPEIGDQTRNRNYVLQGNGGSTAGMVRNWMGFEGFCMAIFDQPDLIREILADLTAIRVKVAHAVTEHIQMDIISWWEDIAFKTGPIVTPEFFHDECGKVIDEVMKIYRGKGTKYAFVDCDGDMRKLVPTWLENGVNIMFPLEVASGVHPENLRKEFPGIRMMGGVDKMILIQDKDAIKRELKRLKILADEGGFIPHVDHRVQADVPYENYLYYLEVKRDLFEIPNRISQ